jgi:hypothetical protein
VTVPTLAVFCSLGLSNRLRVLLSGLALAEASGRQFRMLWPITPACAASFAELFDNAWPVETVDAMAVADLPYISGWFGQLPDLLVAAEPDLVIGHPTWLIQPGEFSDHDRLMTRCEDLLNELQPVSVVQQRVDEFYQRHMRPTVIGVHLRRGDLLRQRPDAANNTAQAIAAVDRFADEYPDAGILLCTDDGAVDPKTDRPSRREGIQETFRLRYGRRVVWTTPRSLDRSTPEAIQDALVDLWLLRATDCFVGTETSSFSELVVFAREIPHILVAGATPTYQRFERLARLAGVYAVLERLGKQQTGRPLPLPALVRHHVGAPYRWIRRVIHRLL